MKVSITIFGFIVFLSFTNYLQAQSPDSVLVKPVRKNNIKLNISSNILYPPAFLIGYERTLFPYQTISVEGGYLEFPELLSGLTENIDILSEPRRGGFKVGADYRFYFKKENKYMVPHGLYWGPYTSFYSFNSERTLNISDTSIATGTLDFNSKLNYFQLGVNLGYQFVLKERITIDMNLFGPSLSYYTAKLDLDGDFDANKENEYLQALLDLMIESFPLFGDLVDDQQIESDGAADLFYAGFRYSVSVGFRF